MTPLAYREKARLLLFGTVDHPLQPPVFLLLVQVRAREPHGGEQETLLHGALVASRVPQACGMSAGSAPRVVPQVVPQTLREYEALVLAADGHEAR